MRLAYPRAIEVRIELNFVASRAQPSAAELHVLYPPAQAFFRFACPHGDCNGQIDLTGSISSAFARSAYTIAGTLTCSGLRGGRACGLELEYDVNTVWGSELHGQLTPTI
jgi:hypothetical protein